MDVIRSLLWEYKTKLFLLVRQPLPQLFQFQPLPSPCALYIPSSFHNHHPSPFCFWHQASKRGSGLVFLTTFNTNANWTPFHLLARIRTGACSFSWSAKLLRDYCPTPECRVPSYLPGHFMLLLRFRVICKWWKSHNWSPINSGMVDDVINLIFTRKKLCSKLVAIGIESDQTYNWSWTGSTILERSSL